MEAKDLSDDKSRKIGVESLDERKESVGENSFKSKKVKKELWITRNNRKAATLCSITDSEEITSDENAFPVDFLKISTPERNNCKVSDNLADCCRTFCELCGLSFALSGMRKHTMTKHKMQITSYKEMFGPFKVIEKVFHKCHLCGKIVLLESDTLGGHMKSAHKIKEKDYKEMFMTNTSETHSHGSPSESDNQFSPGPIKETEELSPVKPKSHVSVTSLQSSPLKNVPGFVPRRSSRSRNSSKSSDFHLLPVEYSSEGSEGSLSNIEDISTGNIPDVGQYPLADICQESANFNLDLGLSCDTISADDELSVDEVDTTEEKKVKKRRKKRTDLKMSPRRAILLKQTVVKLKLEIVSPSNKSESPKSKVRPLPLNGRQLYHGRNWVLISKFEDGEEELECDFSWITHYTKNLLEDIIDVNGAEKTLMNMWNVHVAQCHGIGIVHLGKVLKDFVGEHLHSIVELDLYCNFVCHITGMQQASLISMDTMVNCVIAMQEVMRDISQLGLIRKVVKEVRNNQVKKNLSDSTEISFDSFNTTEEEFALVASTPKYCNLNSVKHLSDIFTDLDLDPESEKPVMNALPEDSEYELYFSPCASPIPSENSSAGVCEDSSEQLVKQLEKCQIFSEKV